jgi:hypothetical protein
LPGHKISFNDSYRLISPTPPRRKLGSFLPKKEVRVGAARQSAS